MNNWRQLYFVIELECDFPIIEAMIFNNPDYSIQLCIFDKIPKKNEPKFWKTSTDIMIWSGKEDLFFKIESYFKRTQVQTIFRQNGSPLFWIMGIVSFSGTVFDRFLHTLKYINDQLINY